MTSCGRFETLDIPGQDASYRLIRPLVGHKSRLQEQLARYAFEDNVFLMMRFRRANDDLSAFMIETLAEAGLRGVRADAQEWNLTNDVYNPLAVLYCCKYGIALFDEPVPDEAYNPNVVYELAVMQHQEKECLILRHAKLPALPFDLIRNLHLVYDRDLAVRENIRTWIARIRPLAGSLASELPVSSTSDERSEIRTPGDSISASEFGWSIKGRGGSREVEWKLRLANDDGVTKRPKIQFILMAEDGFLLSDHTARLKALGSGAKRLARSKFKVPGDFAARLKRIMAICEGEIPGT